MKQKGAKVDSEAQENNFPSNTFVFEFVAIVDDECPLLTKEELLALEKDFIETVEEVYKKYGVNIKILRHPDAEQNER